MGRGTLIGPPFDIIVFGMALTGRPHTGHVVPGRLPSPHLISVHKRRSEITPGMLSPAAAHPLCLHAQYLHDLILLEHGLLCGPEVARSNTAHRIGGDRGLRKERVRVGTSQRGEARDSR